MLERNFSRWRLRVRVYSLAEAPLLHPAPSIPRSPLGLAPLREPQRAAADSETGTGAQRFARSSGEESVGRLEDKEKLFQM